MDAEVVAFYQRATTQEVLKLWSNNQSPRFYAYRDGVVVDTL